MNFEFSADLIRVDICGMHYTLLKTHVIKYPDTRLAKIGPNDPHYDKITDEFKFYRDPSLFPSILGYYATGKMHIPAGQCMEAVKEELLFWQIDETQVSV